MPKPIRVVFAPDYRDGGDYQSLLADTLAAVDVEVAVMSDYRRGLPLARGVRDFSADALHLHWPEKYFQRRRDGLDWLRKLRYPLDRALATSRLPLFATAHNLLPHDRGDEFGVFTCVRDTMRSAHTTFTHSEAARAEVQTVFGLPDDRCVNIPHGDFAAGWPALLPRAQARTALDLTDENNMYYFFSAAVRGKALEHPANVAFHQDILETFLEDKTFLEAQQECITKDPTRPLLLHSHDKAVAFARQAIRKMQDNSGNGLTAVAE